MKIKTEIYYASLAQRDLESGDLGGAMYWFLKSRAASRGDIWAAAPYRYGVNSKQGEPDLLDALRLIGKPAKITKPMRDAYWRESDRGQGHEDAGGYVVRCLSAFAGLEIPERGEGYTEAVQRLLSEPTQ